MAAALLSRREVRVSIEPLSAVPGPMLRDHLLRYGLPPEIIEWKYFDRAFTPGRERGYAWIRNDRVNGMIGMIPFTLTGPSESLACAWTCDWFVGDSTQNPGIGVLLLKGAVERAGLLVTVGGNEVTHRLLPRLASHVDADAAIELTLPLRVGGMALFGRVERRVPVPGLRQLGALPIPRRRSVGVASGSTVRSQSGVHHAVADLMAESPSAGWAPGYDMGHLQWQLVRCPTVESASAYVSDGTLVRAASVFWRLKADRRRWRLAIRMRSGHDAAGLAVLDEAARQIRGDGGQSVSVIVGRHDDQALRVVVAAGFRPNGRAFPFYVLTKDAGKSPTELSRLGYLDSDLGYRF